MHEFITLSIYFSNHLILLVYTSVTVGTIVLGLILRFNAVVRAGVASMRLPASGQEIIWIVYIQNLVVSASACSLRSSPTSTGILSIPFKVKNSKSLML